MAMHNDLIFHEFPRIYIPHLKILHTQFTEVLTFDVINHIFVRYAITDLTLYLTVTDKNYEFSRSF
jgi:hypothetical protein